MEQLINKKEFDKLNKEQKIAKLIEINRKLLIIRGSINKYIYLFDMKDRVHIIPFHQTKYMDEFEFKSLFRKILKTKIDKLNKEACTVTDIVYIDNSYFDLTRKKLNVLNLDKDFNKENATESFIVYKENKVQMDLLIYDRITIKDDGKIYNVISEKPLKEVSYSKFDIDDKLTGVLTNILR